MEYEQFLASHNNCYGWIHTEKWCIMHIHAYKTKKLPNVVSLITKWTLPLNSHQKTGPGHISYVPYWIKVNMFPNKLLMDSWWTPGKVYGLLVNSLWTPSGVHILVMESIWTLSGVHQEFTRSPSGVHQEYQDFIRTPDRVHQDPWGSVTYRLSGIPKGSGCGFQLAPAKRGESSEPMPPAEPD
jgi:hypothetical protein